MATTTHAPPPHAGEILLDEFLEPPGISQATLAEMIGVTVNRKCFYRVE